MKPWLALGAACIVMFASVPATAKGGEFRVYSCTTPDGRALGPTLDTSSLPSGWVLAQNGSFATNIYDRCAFGEPFEFAVASVSTMSSGQSVWARWTAPDGTSLIGVTMWWDAHAEESAANGTGTVQLAVSTDREILLQQNSPLTVAY